jgi:hypothetical protein
MTSNVRKVILLGEQDSDARVLRGQRTRGACTQCVPLEAQSDLTHLVRWTVVPAWRGLRYRETTTTKSHGIPWR